MKLIISVAFRASVDAVAVFTVTRVHDFPEEMFEQTERSLVFGAWIDEKLHKEICPHTREGGVIVSHSVAIMP